jgi:hypothetical protein
MNILEEVADWKLEAKLEESSRYFFPLREADLVLNGKRSFVIGRKGTGKTAISEHIVSIREYDTFSIKLSFKNFPFQDLYSLKDESYSSPNQFITLWKYVIYVCVCKMMMQSEGVDPAIRAKLAEVFQEDPIHTLRKQIADWTTSGFRVNILGVGGDGMLPKNWSMSYESPGA